MRIRDSARLAIYKSFGYRSGRVRSELADVKNIVIKRALKRKGTVPQET